MCFGIISVAALIAVVAVIATAFNTAPTSVIDNTSSRAEPNAVATIVLNPGTSGCQQKSFNNQTGQISDQISPCHGDVVLDEKGMPIPTGTVHTLNSISKSFR
jgi:hypothetical protein